MLTGLELEKRFPGYRLPHDTLALFQPEGGFLAPERCIVSYVEAAQALGAEVHGREQVLGWEPLGEGVRVTTNRDVYEADRLVITAGAWNSTLLDCVGGLLTPERQVLAWLQPSKPQHFTPEHFPVFNLLVDEGRYYGFPVFRVPALSSGATTIWRKSSILIAPTSRTITTSGFCASLPSATFPMAQARRWRLKPACLPTRPTAIFDRPAPAIPASVVTSPCSGHGFKFASVIGEIMADLAERGETRHNIELFRLARFGAQGGARRAAGSGKREAATNGAIAARADGAIRTFW